MVHRSGPGMGVTVAETIWAVAKRVSEAAMLRRIVAPAIMKWIGHRLP